MRILITGAAGFVGRNIVQSLIERDIDFLATDIVNSPFGNYVNYQKLDITDRKAVFNMVRDVDYIFHLSAHPLPASIKDPVTNAKVNILGSLNIMDAAKEFGIKKIVFSSASSLIGDIERNPVDESHPCKPKTPYGVAKLSVEHYLRVYYELYGLNYIIFRFFNVYGPYQYPSSGALIPVVMERIVKGQEVYIFGDGSTARDFIYVGDVVEFFLDCLQNSIKNELFNLGTGKLTTIKEVVELIGKVIGREPKIVYKPARPGEIMNFSADVTKLRECFGKTPETSLEVGLRKTYEWFKREVINEVNR
jgi:UDP-glucose 4-epimerase